jgi:hypothetical protein
MICSFCGDPAAHPATGCVYGSRTIACHACVVTFWRWVVRHTNGRHRGKVSGVDFYAAAGKWTSR